MSWLKKNLLFTIIMVLLATVLGLEIFLGLGRRSTAVEAEKNLQNKVEEYQRLANQKILPHSRNIELTAAEIERQREELDLYVEAMKGSEEWDEKFAAHPTSRSDAVFDIQFFVTEYRQRASAIGLEGLAEDYFGFGAYAQTGPQESLLPTVYKQRVIVAHILDQLFLARPHSLLSVQRPGEEGGERDQAAGGRGGRGQAQQTGGAGFRLNSKLSVAMSDVVQTSPYEVVFTGRASTLRTFLNELASFEMPLIVRSVQVSPAGGDAGARREQQAPERRRTRRPEQTEGQPEQPEQEEEAEPEDENVPLVADNLSRFAVAMEFIEVIPLDNAR